MKRLLVLTLMVIVAALLLAGCGGDSDSSSGEEGVHHPTSGPIAEADAAACNANRRTIEAAVQHYYAMEGTYPTSLQQLVPEFLQSIPACPGGGSYTLQGTTVVCSVHGS